MLSTDLALEVEINLDDSDEIDQREGEENGDKLNQVDHELNTFDDFANSLDLAINKNENMATIKKQ